MYCKTCGKEMNENQIICLGCGCEKGTGTKYCANCGKELTENAYACMNCGVAADFGSAKKNSGLKSDWCPSDKEPVLVIVLAILLGAFGIHNFYLGETKKGILKLCTCWLLVGEILALIDFIKMLMGTYEVNADSFI